MAELDFVFEFLSTTFSLPIDWFSSPIKLMFFFIIPILSLAAFWTSLFTFKLRIFRSTGVNFGLGLIAALVNSVAINWMTPPFAIALGLSGALLSYETKLWSAAAALVLFVAVLWLFPQATAYFESISPAAAWTI